MQHRLNVEDSSNACAQPQSHQTCQSGTTRQKLQSASTTAVLSSLAISACGGGGSSQGGTNNSGTTTTADQPKDSNGYVVESVSTPNTNPTPQDNNASNTRQTTAVMPTESQAARFLMQASFGGTYEQVQAVQNKGFEAWLDDELNKPWVEANSHYNWFKNHGYFDSRTKSNGEIGVDNSLWRKLITAPDVLRQRVAYALSQIFVVSMNGLGAMSWRNIGAICYMDLLEKNAFGTYEALLKAVTLSPAMDIYLNMKGSRKASGSSAPDENYAREVMQLFSIGLYRLNNDGSLKTENGKPIETYTQQNVTQLAAIFTGWWFSSNDNPASLNYLNQPMTNDGKYFTTGVKRFFDQTISASSSPEQALDQVLKYLANHANVGPFIGRQLIQRLVCSNPSAEYIGRITDVFNDDGKGVRGNLKAVVRAILLDDEARHPPSSGTNTYNSFGKLKEPVLRLAQWGRTFKVKSNNQDALVDFQTNPNSPTGPWNIGNLSDDARGIGQAPLRSPTVFNFFRPGYVPPQGDLATASVTAPEFQLCNEVTVAAYLNFIKSVIEAGRNDVQPDYSADYELAKDASKLVERYSLLLTAGTLPEAKKNVIASAVSKISGSRIDSTRNTTYTAEMDRIKATIFLIMATPEFMVLK